jgi:hypothetical protein
MLIAPCAHAQAACKVVCTISPQNNTAFGAAITIQNTGTTAWSSWSLAWTFANGQTVSSLWNGNEIQQDVNPPSRLCGEDTRSDPPQQRAGPGITALARAISRWY